MLELLSCNRVYCTLKVTCEAILCLDLSICSLGGIRGITMIANVSAKTVPRTTIITIALLLLSFLFRFQNSICPSLSWKLQPLFNPLLSFSGNIVS